MNRNVAVFGMALGVVLVAAHAAFAGEVCFPVLGCFDIGGGGGGGGNPAPAPFLAAGIPAFTALGGGVLISKLFRKRKPRA
jgi:hypothetical protein